MPIIDLKKCLYTKSGNLFFQKVGLATFLSFSKVDFCDMVQKKKPERPTLAFYILRTTKFTMNNYLSFIVVVLDFVHKQKSTRMLNE